MEMCPASVKEQPDVIDGFIVLPTMVPTEWAIASYTIQTSFFFSLQVGEAIAHISSLAPGEI